MSSFCGNTLALDDLHPRRPMVSLGARPVSQGARRRPTRRVPIQARQHGQLGVDAREHRLRVLPARHVGHPDGQMPTTGKATCQTWTVSQRAPTVPWRPRCRRAQPPQDRSEPAVLVRHAGQLLQRLVHLVSQQNRRMLAGLVTRRRQTSYVRGQTFSSRACSPMRALRNCCSSCSVASSNVARGGSAPWQPDRRASDRAKSI